MSSSVAAFLRCRAIRPIIKLRHFSSLASSLAGPRVLAPKIRTPSRVLSLISARFASGKAVTTEDKIKSADKKVLRFLKDEIEGVQEADQQRPQEAQLLKDSPFEIIDSPGDRSIILKREFQGEKIEVAVSTYDDEEEAAQDTDEEEAAQDTDEEEAAQDTDEEEAEQDAAEGQTTDDDLQPISLVVTIDKGAGLILEFCCDLDAEDLKIESMAMKRLRDSDAGVIDGPDFSDLDEGFQRALYKYMGARGINVSLYESFQEYMKSKNDREYILWLKNLKEFVEK